MEREWSGNPRRLSRADRLEIERLIWGGETFATAAAAVGCSTKSIQRFMPWGRFEAASSALSPAIVGVGTRGALSGPGRGGLAAQDRRSAWESAVDDLARGVVEREPG